MGVETFLNKLSLVMKHELYSRSLKHPQNSAREPRQLVFEHEFCKLFKALEGGLRVVCELFIARGYFWAQLSVGGVDYRSWLF